MGTIPTPDMQHPLSTRPSLVALLVVSVTQGSDILVDQNSSIDHEVRALLAYYALRSDRDLIVTGAPATRCLTRARQLRDLQQHVGEDRLQDILTNLFEAAAPQLGRVFRDDQVVHELLQVAGQPQRNFERAAAADRELRLLGWKQAKVRRYLTLHGFANSSGTLGVWNHAEYKKLGA
ncbi:hypothetical protein [Terrabacter sp. 2RAF25]|uniref:hypothetical protein n=1 Tax=Terrabacter sp. 2RAF25 TaxID=3232998 RepID=UPI003F98CF2E